MSVLHADVAVVGSELCGYAAAALLAHEKRRVVVLDDGESPDTRQLGDRLVPTGTTLWRPPSSGRAAAIMDELGLRQRARHELGDLVGLGLIDDPDVRMVLEVEPADRIRELERAFGDASVSKVLDGWQDDARDTLLDEAALLYEDGFFEKRRAKKRIERAGEDVDPHRPDAIATALGEAGLGAVVPHLVPYVQNVDHADVGSVAGWLATGPLARGTLAATKDGQSVRDALRALFADVVQGHGGDVLRAHRATSVEVDGKKVARIETDGPNDYAVRAIIDASATRTLHTRLPDGKRTAKTAALADVVPVAGGAAVVRWLIPKERVPRGMCMRAALLSDDPALPTSLVSVVEDLPPAPDAKQKRRPDVVAVIASVRCDAERSHDVAYALEARLEELMPFAKERAEARDILTGDDARLPHLAFGAPDEAQHPFGGRRPQTGYANLFRAGRDLVPALGLDGELAAARGVATAVGRVISKGGGS